MQKTQVQSLVPEDPIHRGAAKPVSHNYWACTLEPGEPQLWKTVHPRARALQQEKPPQQEARVLQPE